MNKIFLVFFAMIVMLGCDQSGNKSNSAKIVKKDTITEREILSLKNEHSDKKIDAMLRAGIDTFIVRMQMNGIQDMKIITLTIVSGKQLFAVIYKENKKSNIRINRVEMPDSTFDGPFGDSLHYKINVAGVYKIMVGPNLMATGKLDGAFKLKAWTK